MFLADLLLVLVYISFAIELIGFPVPSEASTNQLFFPPKKTTQIKASNLLIQIQQLPYYSKVIILLLPTLIGVGTYLLPLLVTIFPSLKQIFGTPTLSPIWFIVGVGIAILGRFITFSSAMHIRKNNSNPNGTNNLKVNSFFNLSRNPILLGLHITFIGLLMTYPVLMMFLGGIVYFLNMHFKIILEEHFLKDKHGDSFIHYCKMTKRYF